MLWLSLDLSMTVETLGSHHDANGPGVRMVDFKSPRMRNNKAIAIQARCDLLINNRDFLNLEAQSGASRVSTSQRLNIAVALHLIFISGVLTCFIERSSRSSTQNNYSSFHITVGTMVLLGKPPPSSRVA